MKYNFCLVLLAFSLLCSSVYAENICSSTSSTADSGTLYDSGGSGSNYSNYENCIFTIEPTSAPTSITLNFSEFNLENDYDFLYIYDGTGALQYQLTGSTLPGNLTINSEKVYIRAINDYSVTRSGFAVSWTSSNSSSTCGDVADDFSSLSYSNNDGSDNWANAWQEVGESDGVSAGKARIRNDLCSSGYCLRLGTPSGVSPSAYSNRGVIREANLSGSSSATLSFNYYTGVNSGSSSVILAISDDGGLSWTNLKTYTISSTNFSANPESFDISSYVSSNTQIRFLGSGSSSSVTGMYIDDIKIDYCKSNGGGGDTVATNFNCVENGLDGITGKLYTKAVNQNFAFDIIALQDASTIETSFASGTDHTVTVELVDASSGSCSTYSSLNPAVSQDVVFTVTDAGNKSSANMSSSTAYSQVRCRMTDNTNSPAVVGCSTDAFTIRPTGFSVTSNMTNSTATGTPTAKAGDNFTLTATASAGYNGTPKIDTGKLEAHSGAVQTGTLSGSFASANLSNGQATGNTFTYTEAGSLRFAPEGIYDDNFTAIDQNTDCTDDFSNTVVGGKIGCKFANNSATNYFGRFTPDHFDVSLNTPVFSPACVYFTDDDPPVPVYFTYVGQPVKYATQPIVNVTAKNSSGNTTQNYTSSFWKIVPTDSTYGITPSYTEASHGLSVLDSNSPTVTDNGNGTGILTFADTSNNILGISRGNPEVEFDAEIAMTFNLSDTDGITVSNVDGSPQTNPISFGAASAGNGISFGGYKTQRWGRIVITNAHGSELSVLPVPLQTEFFKGTDFIPRSDNCTTINLSSHILLSNPATSSGTPQAGNTAMTMGSGTSSATLLNNPVLGGSSGLNFSAPGAGNTGFIDIGSNFSSFPWLLFDWDNDSSHNDSPSGKATFGVFNGSPEQIYFREVY